MIINNYTFIIESILTDDNLGEIFINLTILLGQFKFGFILEKHNVKYHLFKLIMKSLILLTSIKG